MKVIAGAILMGLWAGPSVAQTTSCGMEMGRWVCRTTQPAPRHDPLAAYRQAEQHAYEQNQQFRRDLQAAQDQRDAERGRSLTSPSAPSYALSDTEQRQALYASTLSGLVRDGLCVHAKKYALDHGDLNGADQAVRLCVPR